MYQVGFYLPIAKVDREKRMVFGYASTPTRDLDGEVIELEAIKAALPGYMEWRNVREMHQPSAVGVTKEANIDEKGLYIGAKIVDDEAWKKVIEDVYKGFSIGGDVTDRKGSTITGLDLIEISLVDRPANPDCKIDMKKAAGVPARSIGDETMAEPILSSAIEHGISLAPEEVGLFGRLLAKLARRATARPEGPWQSGADGLAKGGDEPGDGKKPYGDVEYADPGYQEDGKKRYPIDTEAHIRAAWSYIHQKKNADEYTAEQLAAIKRRIVAAWKKKIDEKGPPEQKSAHGDDTGDDPFASNLVDAGGGPEAAHDGLSLPAKCDAAIVKTMIDVKALSEAFDLIRNAQRGRRQEGITEEDGGDRSMSEKLGSVARELASVIRQIVEHEGSEAETMSDFADVISGVGKMADVGLTKRAADGRHHEHIRKAAHHIVEAHKACGAAMECMARARRKDGEFKRADGTIIKAADHFARAMEHMEKAHEHHVLAHHHLRQAVGHKGEPHEQPGDAEPPIYKPEEGLEPLTQREMTEGEVPEYEVDEPYQHGPVGHPERSGMKAVQAELQKKAEEAAYLRGKVEALEKMPASPKARLFAVPRGSLAVGEAEETSATEKLLKGVDLDAATPGGRQAAAGRLIGNMIANSATFARPVLTDPSFRGGAAR